MLDFSAFGGIAKVTLSFKLIEAHEAGTLDICVFAQNWRHGGRLILADDPVEGSFDFRVTDHSPSISEVLIRTNGRLTYVLIKCNQEVPPSETLQIHLESTNLLVPLSERSPVNRSICGFTLTWNTDARRPTRILVHRPARSVTCFTKGNYLMAFPSRPTTGGIRTLLMFGQHGPIKLLYGFIRDPSTVLLRSASNLVFASLGFFAAWLMATVITSRIRAELSQYLAMLASLTVPAATAFAELVVLDRHSLYSRRRDLGFAITMIAISSGILGTIGAVSLSIASGFGTTEVKGITKTLPPLFLGGGIILALLGTALLIGYRSGVIVPYVCDNSWCDRRLFWRYRHRDCYTTGRVMCKRCEMATCLPCPRNVWQRGPQTLDDASMHGLLPWQYSCLSRR